MIGVTGIWAKAKCAVILGAASFALTACGTADQQEADAIAQKILETPGAEELWATIKDEYPEDFDALVARLQSLSPSERRDETRTHEIGAEWLREFFARIAPDAVKAPQAEILLWSAKESELYATLQRSSVTQCAAMTMGQWIFFDENDVAATSAVTRRNTAMVKASAAGRDNPQEYAEPTEADFVQLGDTISATGVDPVLQGALSDNSALAALNAQDQCEIGVAVHRGLSDLPDEIEPRMAAFVLSPI